MASSLCQGSFRLDIRKNFFPEIVLEQAARGSGGVPSLEVLKKCLNVALWDMV